MKIKQSMRYQLHEFVIRAGVFYLVIVSLFLLSLIAQFLIFRGTSVNFTMSGTETTTTIFLLVMGLNSFKPPLRLYVQNGLSRRTLVVSFALSAACFAAAMALIDSIFPLIFRSSLGYSSIFAGIYDSTGLLSILWSMAFNFMALCCGFFISSLYYRMNKLAKVLVSVGVPLVLFVVLPIFESIYPTFRVFTSLIKAVMWILGIQETRLGVAYYPARTIACFTGIGVLLTGLSYLLARRATLKDA